MKVERHKLKMILIIDLNRRKRNVKQKNNA